jgi:hypothetical protein
MGFFLRNDDDTNNISGNLENMYISCSISIANDVIEYQLNNRNEPIYRKVSEFTSDLRCNSTDSHFESWPLLTETELKPCFQAI